MIKIPNMTVPYISGINSWLVSSFNNSFMFIVIFCTPTLLHNIVYMYYTHVCCVCYVLWIAADGSHGW